MANLSGTIDVILVWRMDRGFRSVLYATATLQRLRAWGVGLRSYSEPWRDTTSPFGEALYYITVAYAQLERGILRERVKAGMGRARKQGHRMGRSMVTDRRRFNERFGVISGRVQKGELSRRKAALELGHRVRHFKTAAGGPRERSRARSEVAWLRCAQMIEGTSRTSSTGCSAPPSPGKVGTVSHRKSKGAS